MSKLKCLYLLVGPSACGKTSIAKEFAAVYGAKIVRPYTTRSPRFKDEDNYEFISKEEFLKKEGLVAVTNYAGNYYGASVEQLSDGDIYIVDVPGAKEILAAYKSRPVYVVGITAREDVLRKRMELRGSSEEEVQKRLIADKEIFEANPLFFAWKIPNNNDLASAVDTMRSFVDICESAFPEYAF